MELRATDIADFLDGSLVGGGDFSIEKPCTLDNTSENSVTFMSNPTPERIQKLAGTKTICVLMPHGFAQECKAQADFPHICVNSPRLAFARTVKQFFQKSVSHRHEASAQIHADAKIGKNVHIGHYSIIESDVEIGDDTFIGNFVQIHSNVKIGCDCHIKSHAVIGQQGFGFERDEAENYMRIPHVGGVIIEDHVELGAFSGVASGTIDPSRVGKYTKIDDNVLVGHNASIGENNIIAGGVVVSGSVKSGHHVWFGPNSCMMQGLEFGDESTIGVGAVMFNNANKGFSFGARPSLPVNKK